LYESLTQIPSGFRVFLSSMNARSIGSASEADASQVENCLSTAYSDSYAAAFWCRKRPLISITFADWFSDDARDGSRLSEAGEQERWRESREKYRIRPEERIDAVSRILDAGLTHAVVCTRDLQDYFEDARTLALPALAEERRKSRPVLRLHPRPSLDSPYVAPKSDVERRIAEIWQDLLGIDQIGIDDDFFDLGGHSLLAVRLLARMRVDFNVSFSLRSIFEMPTVTSQADLIAALSWRDEDMDLAQASETVEGEI
jgi:acyl carrier protein